MKNNIFMKLTKNNNGYIQPPVPATPNIAIFQNLKPHAMPPSATYQVCEKSCSGYKKINQICTDNCEPIVENKQIFYPAFNDVGYLC